MSLHLQAYFEVCFTWELVACIVQIQEKTPQQSFFFNMYTLKNNLETLSYLQVKVISEQSCSHKKYEERRVT